jgi:hypothetical protein
LLLFSPALLSLLLPLLALGFCYSKLVPRRWRPFTRSTTSNRWFPSVNRALLLLFLLLCGRLRLLLLLLPRNISR